MLRKMYFWDKCQNIKSFQMLQQITARFLLRSSEEEEDSAKLTKLKHKIFCSPQK